MEPRPRRRHPALTVRAGRRTTRTSRVIDLPRFDTVDGRRDSCAAGCPVRRVGEHLVHGVRPDAGPVRGGAARAARRLAHRLRRRSFDAVHPAWQEPITGCPGSRRSGSPRVRAQRRGIRRTVDDHHGRRDRTGGSTATPPTAPCFALLPTTGSMGRNGGAGPLPIGREKCRPVTGWATMAMASDWSRPPRQMAGTSYWYAHTDQRRYDGFGPTTQPGGPRPVPRRTPWTCWPPRWRWAGRLPFFPQFDRSSLTVADEAAEGKEIPEYVAEQLASGSSSSPIPDGPAQLAAGARRLAGQPWARRARALRTFCAICWAPPRTCRRTRRSHCGPTTSRGATTFRRQARPADVDRLPDDLERCSPMWCCPRRPGTRRPTCRAPTCIPTCMRSAPPSIRRGKPGRTMRRSARSPRVQHVLAKPTWVPAPMWCSAPCSTTPRCHGVSGGSEHDWRVRW